MAGAKKQPVEVPSSSPTQNAEKRKTERAFELEYLKKQTEEKRERELKEKDYRAWMGYMEKKNVHRRLLLEIKKYLDNSSDLSLVEKEEIIDVVKKFSVVELTSLKETLTKDGLKEGLAQIKGEIKFQKGQKAAD